MGEYFKPLRRKIGVLTLGLACVAAAGWVRSQTVTDRLSFKVNNRTWHTLFSCIEGVGWQRDRYEADLQSDPDVFDLLEWQSDEDTNRYNMEPYASLKYWPIFRFDISRPNPDMKSVYVRYSVVVIPLTLLSAWLLLSKSRSKPQPTSP